MFRIVRSTSVLTLCVVGALTIAATALAHAGISPPVVVAKKGQEFTITVPTEGAGHTTSSVEVTPPSGFTVFGFSATPGWKRDVQQTGSGEEAVVEKITWSGGSVPEGEYGAFRFTGMADSSGTYAWKVRQTYSDGEVADWSGPEGSDEPAPILEAVSSVGGGSSSTWTIVALIAAIVALLIAVGGLAAKGRRAVA
jgi:uncharacterized protein YcnI